MADEKKTYPNSGLIFKNDNKRDEKDRAYRGDQNTTCRHCGAVESWWLSGWVRVAKNGSKFISYSLKPKDAAPSAGTQRQAPVEDEEAPF